ncbi:MAG TPA: DNA primase [Candidatus Saccharimonadales bacterium]|nr:DNA primase [Candidatus Saccharimonadales bacterium]
MDAPSEVKSRLNIEDVVSEYVQLKRAGRNFKGLSPWTNEKTASFIVSPEKQIWHDFSSGKGGDIFSFVMEMEGLDFKGALEQLARKAGVDLDQFKGSKPGVSAQLKNRALEVLELSTKFYQRQLAANRPAYEYLAKQRGFSKQTILAWRLGYAPNTGSALTNFLTKHSFTTDEMKRAGMIFQRQTHSSDMFRGRIMIPLADSSGQIVGFTARLLADEPDAPKYINTPGTVTYDKSRQIFGLHMAKEAIRKTGFVVVVEGNLDVISSWQAGVTNVVASAGTAMTEDHLKALKRFTGDIRLSFDTDRAGIAATERIIPLAGKAGVELKIITIKDPDVKDPDELIRKDVHFWNQAIEEAQYAPDWLIDRYKEEYDLSTAVGKKAFTDTLLGTIRRLSDPVEQEHYLKLIAKLTDTSLEAVQAKFSSKPSQTTILKRAKTADQPIDKAQVEFQRLQDHFLAMLLMEPNLRGLTKGCRPEFFTEGPSRQIFYFIKQNPEYKLGPKPSAQLQVEPNYVNILVLQFEELYQGVPTEDLQEQATHLKRRLIDRYVKIQKNQLAAAMRQTADDKEIKTLISQVDKLNELIKSA